MKGLLYEDNHLLVAFKPPGLLTQSTAEESDSLENRARAYIKETRNKPGAVYLHAVHRLDRVASGILVFGLSQKATSRLNNQPGWRKEYLAVINKELEPNAEPVELSHWHRKGGHRAVISETPGGRPGTKPARLAYRVLAAKPSASLLQIELFTGRYHQIRAQLAFALGPIYGDTRYGGPEVTATAGIGLCHRRLRFTHPVQKTELDFQCLPAKEQAGFSKFNNGLSKL